AFAGAGDDGAIMGLSEGAVRLGVAKIGASRKGCSAGQKIIRPTMFGLGKARVNGQLEARVGRSGACGAAAFHGGTEDVFADDQALVEHGRLRDRHRSGRVIARIQGSAGRSPSGTSAGAGPEQGQRKETHTPFPMVLSG